MKLEKDNWYLGYQEILKVCREGSGSSALILCHAQVDALCAGRIFSYMLRQDNVNHQIYPCISQAQLQKRVSANRLCRAVVLMNLGATRNLTRLFDVDNGGLDHTWTKVFVMDCRRPVHLANVYAERNIVVFWDTELDELPSDGDNLSGDDSSSSSSSSDDDDDEDDRSSGSEENEFDDKEKENELDKEDFSDDESQSDVPSKTGVPTERPEEPKDVGMEQDTDYDGEDEGDGDRTSRREADDDASVTPDVDLPTLPRDEPTETPPSQQLPTLTPREQHNERRGRLRKYYAEGSYYSSPAAYVAYTIATHLRFTTVGDLLWLACVGVTDAYIHSRLDVSGYSEIALHLRNVCNGLFPNDDLSRVSHTIYAEHLLGTTNNTGSETAPHLTRISMSGNGRILSETDFRFFLLRHSSLLDAMLCSDYVTTRLQLPTDAGMHKLYELLAKMGYPLDQCQQPFAFMKPALRRQLQDKLRDYAEEYGLTNFEFTSFFRITGYQSLLSASDTSYAVAALLECDALTSWMDGTDTVPDDEEQLVQAFNVAYDALNSNPSASAGPHGLSDNTLGNLVNGGKLNQTSGLGAGIHMAKSLQKSIMTMAGNLIDRSAITRLSHFRYAYITISNQAIGMDPVTTGDENLHPSTAMASRRKESHVFAKPLTLTRLAHYLMDWHRENGKWTGIKARPLVLLAEKPRTKTFVVVGYEYPESAGEGTRNKFGHHFALAAQSMPGTFTFDSFDSNVVEVEGATDAQRFLEQLHYLIDSSHQE